MLVLDSHIKAAGLDERVVVVDCVELEKDFEFELCIDFEHIDVVLVVG